MLVCLGAYDAVARSIDEARRERRSAILGLTGLILCAVLLADVTLAIGPSLRPCKAFNKKSRHLASYRPYRSMSIVYRLQVSNFLAGSKLHYSIDVRRPLVGYR